MPDYGKSANCCHGNATVCKNKPLLEQNPAEAYFFITSYADSDHLLFPVLSAKYDDFQGKYLHQDQRLYQQAGCIVTDFSPKSEMFRLRHRLKIAPFHALQIQVSNHLYAERCF